MSGSSATPSGAGLAEPGRPMPPASSAPAARTSSTSRWPIRPVTPAMPMRIAMSFLPSPTGAILLASAAEAIARSRELVRLRHGVSAHMAWHAAVQTSPRRRPRASPSVAGHADDVEPVVLDLPIEQLQPGFGHHLRATLPELPVNPSGRAAAVSAAMGRRSADRHLAAQDRVPVRRSEHATAMLVQDRGRAAWKRSCLCPRPISTPCARSCRPPWLIRSSGDPGRSVRRSGATLPPACRRPRGRSALSVAVRSRELAGSTDSAARRLADRPDLPVPAR